MTRTLRGHVQEAERILSILGLRTLIPQKGLPAPIRVDASNRELEYAVSVRVVIERHDRTGYARTYLTASDDVAGTVWQSIPERAVCPLCLSRTPQDRPDKGRIYCRPCGAFIRPKNLRGLVSADLRKMRQALNNGEIRVRTGERA